MISWLSEVYKKYQHSDQNKWHAYIPMPHTDKPEGTQNTTYTLVTLSVVDLYMQVTNSKNVVFAVYIKSKRQ